MTTIQQVSNLTADSVITIKMSDLMKMMRETLESHDEMFVGGCCGDDNTAELTEDLAIRITDDAKYEHVYNDQDQVVPRI